MSTATDLDMGIDLDSLHEETSPENVAHMVKRQGALGAGALIEYAAANGLEIEALCGWRWVPKIGHAPDSMDACKPCVEVWQQMTGGT